MSPLLGTPGDFADGDLGLGLDRNRVDHQGVALPMADGVAVKGQIRIVGMRTPVGIDAAQAIAVGFAQHVDDAGGEGELHGVVGDQHPGGHALGQTVAEELVGPAGLLSSP